MRRRVLSFASVSESLSHSLNLSSSGMVTTSRYLGPTAMCVSPSSPFPSHSTSLLPNPTNKTLSFLISMHFLTSHHITFSQTHPNPTRTTLKPPQQHGEHHHHHRHLLSKSSTLRHFPNHHRPFCKRPRRRFSNAGSQEQPQPAGVDGPGPMHVGPRQVLRR